MQTLQISTLLNREFKTVVAVLESEGETRCTDALLLSWVKHEKQFRRLFSYLIYRQNVFSYSNRKKVDGAIQKNKNLDWRTLKLKINKLCSTNISALVGERHSALNEKIGKIGRYRNKIMHGQLSGDNISVETLINDAQILVDWMDLLGAGAIEHFGYDGIERQTYCKAMQKKESIEVYEKFKSFEDLMKFIS